MKNRKVRQTTVNEYFAWLEQTVLPGSRLHTTAHEFLEAERSASIRKKEHTTPFLSVITRTQGKRPDMLRETLLCLTGQSDTDFELLLMGHNLTAEQKNSVEGLVAELPAEMRAKTRLIEVHGGTRTTPLNKGFEAARGEYVAVLDDDDLVLDNWVEVFHDLAKAHFGTVLHTYCIIQDWETLGGRYPNVPRAVGSPDNRFCVDFQQMNELSLNRCPLCSLAFPSYAFHEWGIRFDESLTTTEDWDYLMRCSFLTGVSNTHEPTQIYRNWINAENSATVHGKQEWAKNYRKIVTRFVQTPIVMPAKSLHGVIDTQLPQIVTEDDKIQLLYDDGSDFSDEKALCLDPSVSDPDYPLCFVFGKDADGNPAPSPAIRRIRFDPQPLGYLTVTDFCLRVEEVDGTRTDYPVSNTETNGYSPDDCRIIFWRNDPQIIVTFDMPKQIRRVFVRCNVEHLISDSDMDEALSAAKNEMQLFFDAGNGYNEANTFKRDLSYRDRVYNACFLAPQKDEAVPEKIYNLRFDPQYTGLLTLSDLQIRVVKPNGETIDFTAQDTTNNGFLLDDRIVFFKNDPQILLHFENPLSIAHVLIHCHIEKSISDEDIDRIIASFVVLPAPVPEKRQSLLYRALRKVYRAFKKIFHRKK